MLGEGEALSELLLHFAIPFAAFSYFRRPREAFVASLIALFPDIDALLIGVHRSMSHSLVVVLAVCGVAFLMIRVLSPKLLGLGLLATLGLLSHLLLDLFTTHTPVFWPLVSWSLFISIGGGVHVSESLNLKVNLHMSTTTTDFTPFTTLDAPIFTSEGFALSLILIGAVFVNGYSGRLRGLLKRFVRRTVCTSHGSSKDD